jgi:murein DD-endopeptidase MepM/ murein hydrolase activator NlpD
LGSPGTATRLTPKALPALAAALALSGCGHWTGAAHPPRWEQPAKPEAKIAFATGAQARSVRAAESGQRGAFHTVRSGETLYRIARTYGVPLEVLVQENGIENAAVLEEGRVLFVPGAQGGIEVPQVDEEQAPGARRRREPIAQLPRAAQRALDPAAHGGPLAWPVRGVLFSPFGARARDQHDGIDLAAPEGTPVLAAAGGTVLFAGEQRGYGRIVLLGHEGPLRELVTVYAHNEANLVATGDRVERGQAIARVGHSGNATGPHLHFEVRVSAHPRDPLGFLR